MLKSIPVVLSLLLLTACAGGSGDGRKGPHGQGMTCTERCNHDNDICQDAEAGASDDFSRSLSSTALCNDEIRACMARCRHGAETSSDTGATDFAE